MVCLLKAVLGVLRLRHCFFNYNIEPVLAASRWPNQNLGNLAVASVTSISARSWSIYKNHIFGKEGSNDVGSFLKMPRP